MNKFRDLVPGSGIIAQIKVDLKNGTRFILCIANLFCALQILSETDDPGRMDTSQSYDLRQ